MRTAIHIDALEESPYHCDRQCAFIDHTDEYKANCRLVSEDLDHSKGEFERNWRCLMATE